MTELAKKIDQAAMRLLSQVEEKEREKNGQIHFLATSLLAYLIYKYVDCFILYRDGFDWLEAKRYVDANLDHIVAEFFLRRSVEIFTKNLFREEQDDRTIFNHVMIDYFNNVFYKEVKDKLPSNKYGLVH